MKKSIGMKSSYALTAKSVDDEITEIPSDILQQVQGDIQQSL